MTFLSKTSSLLMLMSLMSTVLGARIDIDDGGDEKSQAGAMKSTKQTPEVCGFRPYDYLFDESSQRSVHDKLLRNGVGNLKDQPDQKNIKIVGGNIAVHGEFPWQARIKLLYRNGSISALHKCGAVVISEHWLLSAAHCFEGKEEYVTRIIVGDHSLYVNDGEEQEFDAERIINHEKYDDRTVDNDIALIKLRPTSDGRGIQFNNFVQPACLPDSTTPFTEGTECLISGWGTVNKDGLFPKLLQGAKVPLIHQTVCNHLYGRFNFSVTDNMICAGYVDGGIGVCSADSGGPLVSKTEGAYTLYGITSWNIGCAHPGAPDVFTRVSSFLPWIKSKINAYSNNIEQGTLPSKPE